MVQLRKNTSISSMIPIFDFHYIYELAKCSKCQIFILLEQTNTLYGFSNDCCSIHEITVPFKVNTDLAFELSEIDTDILNSNKNFFIPNNFNWVIIPEYYWDMYINGDLVKEYDFINERYDIKDKTTNKTIDQFHMIKAASKHALSIALNQLSGWFNRLYTLSTPELFTNLQNNDVVRNVYDNRVSMGRSLIRLTNNNIDVAFYIYKGLFTLNKSDSLDIEIRFDRFESEKFMATFKTKRKRNPMSLNTYGVPFDERVHCMYLNICQ